MTASGRVGLVVNPVHRRSTRACERLLDLAVAANLQPLLRPTTVADPGRGQARDLITAGCDSVVAIGGDGTAREVAYALAGTDIPLGIVPTGTANLAARNLGLPLRLADGVRVALTGTPRPIDLGLASLDGGPDHPFLAYAGIGQDAATIAAMNPARKRQLGPLGWIAYLAAGAGQLTAPPSPMSIRSDDGSAYPTLAWCVLVGNGGRLPARIRVFPGAEPDDGTLEALEVSGRLARWPLVAAEGVLNRPLPGSGLARSRVRAIEVTTPQTLPVHADGDVIGTCWRANFLTSPGAVRIRTESRP